MPVKQLKNKARRSQVVTLLTTSASLALQLTKYNSLYAERSFILKSTFWMGAVAYQQV